MSSGQAVRLTDEEERKLAEIYRVYPLQVARVCDEVLDRRGGLLGRIRELSRDPRNSLVGEEEA